MAKAKAETKKDKGIFRFKNIGPIGEAELELGDLTVIAGANSSGKTYLTYTLYGFLEYINSSMNIDTVSDSLVMSFERMSVSNEKEPYRSVGPKPGIKIHADKNGMGILKASMKIDDVKEYIDRIIKYACEIFSCRIGNVFASQEKFKDSTLQYEKKGIYSLKEKMFTLEVNDSTRNVEITFSKNFFPSHTEFSNKFYEDFIRGLIVGAFVRQQIPSSFILSAERLNISIFYKELDFTKSKIIELLQNLDEKSSNKDVGIYLSKHTARYAKPIKDNIDYTRNLDVIQKQTGDFADSKFFDDIKNMMRGSYRYENNDIFFTSQKKGEGGFKIPLHLASSSVRELSDLYFYLKHTAQKGQLLIIDEPESHLDTANQIIMARILVRCVNAGMKVLVTTHSDYIIKEFNNLIMLSHEFPEKKSFLYHHKKEYTADSFLKRESVKAYICGDGTLARCEVDSRGMIMPIFDKTIDDINSISNMLDSYLPEEE